MKRKKTVTLFLCVPMICCYWGCLSTGRPTLSKEKFMKSVYMNEIKPALDKTGGSGDLKISFQGALELSVLNDENLALHYYSWKKDLLDLKQARSMRFPRVNLQVFNETYYSDEDRKIKNNIDGGLLLQYNLVNLLFQRDNISIQKAASERSIIKGRIEVQNIFFRLLTRLMEIEYHLDEVKLREKALQYANDGLTIWEQFAKEGRIRTASAWRWTNDVQDAREKYEEAKSSLAFSQRSLKYMLGKINAGHIEVSNAEAFMPGISHYRDMDIKVPDAVKDAWAHRYEVKLAEIDLFLSEMALLKSKISWLKYFRISLGFGRFFIFRDDERANVTLNTSLLFPVLDLGDTKRIKKKAKIDRDMARVRAVNLARKISREVREAVDRVDIFKRRLMDAGNMVKKAGQQKEIVKRMIRLNQAEPLDLYAVRLAALRAESNYNRICFEFKKAVLHLKKVRGTLLNKKVEEKLIKKRKMKNENQKD
jgi:outer membrane protein TolC